MRLITWITVILYLIVCIALFSILQFEHYKRTPTLDESSTFWIWFRIIFTAPLLIVAGLLLTFFIGGKHRVPGILSMLTGAYWVVSLIQDAV